MNSLLLGRGTYQGLLTTAIGSVARRWKGGGRPGGRPAFSWKQKRILGLDVEKKKRLSNKIDEIGPMESLEGIYGEEFGDFMVDLKDPNMTQEKLELIMPQSFNRLKKVEISRLFGSNKPCGQLENKW